MGSENLIRKLVEKTTVPLVLKGFILNSDITKWSEEKWSSVFNNKDIPFRCMKKDSVSDEPCWERQCTVRSLNFKEFLQKLSSEEWMYFDYKYIHQWFPVDSELCKGISWKQFGYPDKGPSDSTLWVGSKGAHTPCHQDTYGFNIVVQLHGRKRWVLFPPETGGMKPTRVPYEESSVYSELNFYCPNDLDRFHGLTGARMVELSAGDALVVPRCWWHYVQNVDTLNVAINTWVPHEKDSSAQVSEALIKILVAQLCKDLPQETARLLVNPNEDDISDTPLAVLFLQLEAVAKAYLEKRRKLHRYKRQKIREDDHEDTSVEDFDLQSIIDSPQNKIEIVPNITNEELIDLLKVNLREFANEGKPGDDDEIDGLTGSLCLTKAVIDAFSQSNVIDLVKQNLFTRLSEMQ